MVSTSVQRHNASVFFCAAPSELQSDVLSAKKKFIGDRDREIEFRG
jgi:hypothetical protein